MKNQKGNPYQMKPNELRIGNIVVINNPKSHPTLKDVLLRVVGVHENSNGYIVSLQQRNNEPNIYHETYSQMIKFIDAVPLTEELLLKCGFVKTDGFYYTYNCSFTLNYDKFDDGSYNAKSQSYNIARGIKYLHQLQNLYFALTGEELEINL